MFKLTKTRSNMHISEILKKHKPALSFEFFPPKSNEGSENLFQSIKELTPLKPAYVSVTYGAGGGTRDLTHDLITKIQKETDLTVVSHLTCVGHTKDEIKEILERYDESGIHNILALRGDPPKGQSDFIPVKNGFTYASDLVGFIKKHFPHMGVGVAAFPEGHPGCPNRIKELDYLKKKVDEGADYLCTQLFFDNHDFFDFKERCEIIGINIPMIAGIMPITSIRSMGRMAELALGSKFPAKLLKALSRAQNDELVAKVGTHWATQQVQELIDNGVDGVHFYTLNKSKTTQEIYRSLGLENSQGARGSGRLLCL